MKKLISLILSITLILSCLVYPVYALGSKEKLNTDVKLSKNDVLSIANYHINNYLKYDVQTENKDISASKEFINLYDINGDLFAYIVPLIENKKQEIGYITVGAIENGYDVYEVVTDYNKLYTFKNSLDKDNSKSSIVFIPPMIYIMKTTEGGTEKYFDIFNDKKEITEYIIKDHEKLSKLNNLMRKPENKVHIKEIIKKQTSDSINNAPMSVIYSSGSIEDVRLSKEEIGSFVPVFVGATKYYGGDQRWWPKDTDKYNRGCGPVAAANITCYLAKKDNTKYGKLYPQFTLSQPDFMKQMNLMYTYINPGVFGEPSLLDWSSDVERYAADKGVTLTRVRSSSTFTLDNTATYIKAGLNSECPVACLNIQLFGYYYGKHWMTITKYYKDASDNRWVAVSTWGERHSINYKTWFDSTKLFGGGLMYFK